MIQFESLAFLMLLLNAIATGTGISVSIIDRYDTDISPFESAYVSKALYAGNKESIIKAINKFETFSEKCGNATLISYSRLDNRLTKSVYDNGVVVYTNPTDENIEIEGTVIASKEFVMKGEE